MTLLHRSRHYPHTQSSPELVEKLFTKTRSTNEGAPLCGIHRYHRQQQSSLIPQRQEQKQQEQKQRSNQNRNYPLTTNSNIEKEVDFYTNPTDLFRWINFRRWDGATSCVKSKPEEAETWILSRHVTDGRILWRQLPLHLVSVNSGTYIQPQNPGRKGSGNIDEDYLLPSTPTFTTSNIRKPYHAGTCSRQVEDLIEGLLSAYPKAASLADNRGMLPIHLCLESITELITPNHRVLNMLLLAHPTAIHTKDALGRTPMDIVIEKSKSITANNIDTTDGAIQILIRVQKMIEALEYKKNEKVMDNTQEANEIQLKLELAQTQNSTLNEKLSQLKNERDELHQSTQKDMIFLNQELTQLRMESDNILSDNASLKTQVKDCAVMMVNMKQTDQKVINENYQEINELNIEASATRETSNNMERQNSALNQELGQLKNERDKIDQSTKRDIFSLNQELTQLRIERKKIYSDNATLRTQVKDCAVMAVSMKQKEQKAINKKDQEINELNIEANNNEVQIMKERDNVHMLSTQVLLLESQLNKLGSTSQQEKGKVVYELECLQQELTQLRIENEKILSDTATLKTQVKDCAVMAVSMKQKEQKVMNGKDEQINELNIEANTRRTTIDNMEVQIVNERDKVHMISSQMLRLENQLNKLGSTSQQEKGKVVYELECLQKDYGLLQIKSEDDVHMLSTQVVMLESKLNELGSTSQQEKGKVIYELECLQQDCGLLQIKAKDDVQMLSTQVVMLESKLNELGSTSQQEKGKVVYELECLQQDYGLLHIKAEDLKHQNDEYQASIKEAYNQIESESKLHKILTISQQEKDEVVSQLKSLQEDNSLLHSNASAAIYAREQEIKKLNAEVTATIATADAMKVQMGNDCTRIQDLREHAEESKSELQKKLTTSQQEKTKIVNELNYLQHDHGVLQTKAEDLKQQNATLHERTKDLAEFVSGLSSDNEF